jgi:nucleoside-diphosphate-sugar epimerase
MNDIADSCILITGGAGFIGANLIRRLLRENVTIHVLAHRESSPWRLKEMVSKINIRYSDLAAVSELKRMIKIIKPDYIFHLARPNYLIQDIQENLKTTVMGTANLLEAVESVDFKHFVYFGSSTEYGFKNDAMRESDLLQPMSTNGISKATASLLCMRVALSEKRPITVLRPFIVYGRWDIGSRFLPTLILSALKGREVEITDSEYKRDWIFVEDVIAASLLVIQNSSGGEIFNVGTGEQYSNEIILKKVEDFIGKKIKYHKGRFPPRQWDTKNWVADISKAKKMLGWIPQHGLFEGLQKTINWFEKNLDKYE